MAIYETTLELAGAYAIDAALLEDIFKRAGAFLQKEVSVELKFGEVHKLNSDSLEDVLNDSLLRTDFITEIKMRGSNYKVEPNRSFTFRASNETFSSTCKLEITGDQDACRTLSSHIEKLLQAKRQWYSSMVITGSYLSVYWLLGLALLVLAIPVALAWLLRPSLVPVLFGIEASGILIWLVLLNWLRQLLFPKLIVEIGRSLEVESRARGARRFLFGTVLLTLILGVAASLIASYISVPH